MSIAHLSAFPDVFSMTNSRLKVHRIEVRVRLATGELSI